MANPLRKTMVYLGLADEELEHESVAPVAPVPQPHAGSVSPSAHQRGAVTPFRKNTQQKIADSNDMNEILTVHPKQYKDAQIIAENFREGVPVIINLSQMTDADARRLIDFAGGLSQGLYGKIERVTSKVFLLSPAHISVTGENVPDVHAESSFFVQS